MTLEEQCLRIIDYTHLFNESKKRENNIKISPFYNLYGRYNEMNERLAFQKEVTDRISNRIETLKNGL